MAQTINDLHSFAIMTLGCKVNTHESNQIANDLLAQGLVQLDFDNVADIYIINTCSVTNTADSKSRNMINRAHKTNPQAIIIVCGCYSQVASKDIKDKLKIDILLGNKYKNNLVNLINEYLATQKQIVKVENLMLEKQFEDTKVQEFQNNTRAFLKIQDGCNFMCSYCIIPFTRGRQRCKKHLSILQDIHQLIQNGYKEIVLTGVNTAGYFDDNGYGFYDLLKDINAIEGDFRVRISSVEPFQISDEIIALISLNPHRFAQHWHLCLQSGDVDVLKAMNRHYTPEWFLELVNKIKKLNPLVAISTDLICGFPTETDQNFANTMQFLKEVGFFKIHVFPYSMRSFTPAARMKQLPEAVKNDRVKQVMELEKELYKNYLTQFVNRKVEVLFEKDQANSQYYVGHCSEFFPVYVKKEFFDHDPHNEMHNVIIEKIVLDLAIGHLEDNHENN